MKRSVGVSMYSASVTLYRYRFFWIHLYVSCGLMRAIAAKAAVTVRRAARVRLNSMACVPGYPSCAFELYVEGENRKVATRVVLKIADVRGLRG